MGSKERAAENDRRSERQPAEAAAPEPDAPMTGAPGPDGGESAQQLEVRLAEAEAKAEEHWNQYLRAVAELDNVRKRASRDVENAHKYALERFVGELLAVKDSLEMGLASADADVATLREGQAATLRQLEKCFEQFGITEIDPLGEPFDPRYHEAMATQPSAEAQPDSVLQVVQKGYRLADRLLRPARVIVARPSA